MLSPTARRRCAARRGPRAFRDAGPDGTDGRQLSHRGASLFSAAAKTGGSVRLSQLEVRRVRTVRRHASSPPSTFRNGFAPGLRAVTSTACWPDRAPRAPQFPRSEINTSRPTTSIAADDLEVQLGQALGGAIDSSRIDHVASCTPLKQRGTFPRTSGRACGAADGLLAPAIQRAAAGRRRPLLASHHPVHPAVLFDDRRQR